MTIDEAVVHCMETAAEKEAVAEVYKALAMDSKRIKESIAECQDCAEEHRQLAEWLEELKYYHERNTKEPVYSYAPGAVACPACGRKFFEEDAAWKAKYCFHCGQKLQWLAVEKWEAKPIEQKG